MYVNKKLRIHIYFTSNLSIQKKILPDSPVIVYTIAKTNDQGKHSCLFAWLFNEVLCDVTSW